MIGLLEIGNLVASVTTYALAGPSTATVGIVSDNFTVTLGPDTLASPVVITPNDGGKGGTFGPATVTLTDAARSATFTYTPALAGSITISVTNSGGLTNPAPIVLTSSAAPAPEVVTHGPIIMLRPAPTRWYHRG